MRHQITIHDEIIRSWVRLKIEISRQDDGQVASFTCSILFRGFWYSIQLRQQDLNLS